MTIPQRSKNMQTSANIPAQQSGNVSYDLSNADYFLPFFSYITTPKDTAITSPKLTEINLPIGRVNRLWVEFPKGCAGLVGVQLFRGIDQVFPLPSETWFRSDNAVLNFSFSHVIQTEPYIMTIKTYNIDDTYSHTIWLAFEVSGLISNLSPDMAALIKILGG